MTKLSATNWALKIFICLLLSAALATAQNDTGNHPAAGSDAVSSQAISSPYETLHWQTMFPEMGKDSPQISISRVDPKTGATQLMIRSPKSLHVPMHWHTANETHTVIRGTAVFEHDGKLAKLTSGGFNYMPARMQHEAWLSSDCVLFITVDGAWDVNWVSHPPSKADLGQKPPASF